MNDFRPNVFEALVQRFFEAAAVPELWPNVLQELADACGGGFALAMPVCGIEPLGPVASTEGGEYFHDFQTRWQAPELNTRMSRCTAMVERGWRGIITENDAFTSEELARDPFQQEFVRRHGYWSYAGAVVATAPGLALPIAIERPFKLGPFSRDEIDLMNKLFDHIRAAGTVAIRIGMASNVRIADALSAGGQPMALLGRDGSVVHMNARFERLIGNGLLIKAGQLTCGHPDANRALAAAIEKAIRHDGQLREPLTAVILPRRDGLRPLVARVLPVVGSANDVLRMVAAIVTVTDLEAADTGPMANVLEEAFGLTPAEARLASQIATGKTLAEIARQQGSGRETLRSQLKAVFEKTGTSRQAELALLLSKLAGRSG
jgi:DNA-binding CsgD family transcriptional regulator/PAS domain-containing protein